MSEAGGSLCRSAEKPMKAREPGLVRQGPRKPGGAFDGLSDRAASWLCSTAKAGRIRPKTLESCAQEAVQNLGYATEVTG
jgi:hypothetical protein